MPAYASLNRSLSQRFALLVVARATHKPEVAVEPVRQRGHVVIQQWINQATDFSAGMFPACL